MSDARNERDPQERGQTHRQSRRWLIAAVAATVVCAVLVGYAILALGTSSNISTQRLPSAVRDESTELVVAVARTPGGPTEWANWTRVIKYLSDELDTPVTVRYLSEEDKTADVVESEDIDIAFVCAHQYLMLEERGAAIGVASPIIDDDHMSRSMIIVRADDPATCLTDLEDEKVAAPSKSALGGYAYLNDVCDEHGIDPPEYFSEVRLGDTQEAYIGELINGEVRAAVVNTAQMTAWDMSDFKAVETSPEFGTPPVVVDADMDEELRRLVRDALLSFDAETELPEDSHISGFSVLNDADYAYAKRLRGACDHAPHP